MEFWSEVRRTVLTGELSKRAACRKFNINFRTLQKILRHEEPPGYQQTKPRRKLKLEPFLPLIHEILKSDRKVHRKQRHTAKRIFERLCEEYGFAGGETIVKDAVRLWKQKNREVFLPLSHPPGEAQVDFGFARVKLKGQETKIALFVMTLPYSGAVFCQAFPRECTEAFLEGHKRAFAYFGGVPCRVTYDNSTIAVAKVLKRRERKLTREFLRLKSHYLFQEHFCLVRRPNEKGNVERLLESARRNFLVPIPRVDSLELLNEQLREQCESSLQHRSRGKPVCKAEMLGEDQAAFLPLPGREFEARRLDQASADSLSLVRFDRNSYSVPTKYAHREITIVATIDEVRLIHADRLIARHKRSWNKEQLFFDPVHYLALLERKPGGFDHAKPLENWNLPSCFALLRRRLEADPDGRGTREYIRVLRLLESFPLAHLTNAVEYALDIGVVDPDSIRVILEYRVEQPADLFALDGRPHLRSVRVETTDVSTYQALLEEV